MKYFEKFKQLKNLPTYFKLETYKSDYLVPSILECDFCKKITNGLELVNLAINKIPAYLIKLFNQSHQGLNNSRDMILTNWYGYNALSLKDTNRHYQGNRRYNIKTSKYFYVWILYHMLINQHIDIINDSDVAYDYFIKNYKVILTKNYKQNIKKYFKKLSSLIIANKSDKEFLCYLLLRFYYSYIYFEIIKIKLF